MDNFLSTQSVRIAEIERRLDAIEHRLKSLGAAPSAANSTATKPPDGDDADNN